MTSEQRQKASRDLTVTFLNSYYPSWRLAKVLGIEKILTNKYEFYKNFANDIKNEGDENGDATIAQEIKNGLYFDAISECIQYVEDLFAFIRASTMPDYFIKEFVNYYANNVSKSIKKFDVSKESISKAFHFPIDYSFTEDHQITFNNNVELLSSLVKKCIDFYSEYRFVYNQYKHGLKVGMRPFGNVYNSKQIDEDKNGQFAPYLCVFDNVNLADVNSQQGIRNKNMLFMPGLSPDVLPVITELIKENNFLRLIPIHDERTSIGTFVDIAYIVRCCVQVFKYNYSWKIHPEKNLIKFQLPDGDYKDNMYNHYTLQLEDTEL